MPLYMNACIQARVDVVEDVSAAACIGKNLFNPLALTVVHKGEGLAVLGDAGWHVPAVELEGSSTATCLVAVGIVGVGGEVGGIGFGDAGDGNVTLTA